MNVFTTGKSRVLWTEGVINPITRKIPTSLRQDLLMENEKEALASKVNKFGKGSAGASLTQIATWSNILLCNTIMENEAFNIQMTLRTTGSLGILDKTGPKHAMATCQIRSQNPGNSVIIC